MSFGVVICAHGARNESWSKPARELGHILNDQLSDTEAIVAFLQFGEPDLETAIMTLAGKDIKKIVVIPYFISTGGHLFKDIPELIAKLQEQNEGLEITMAQALGEHAFVMEAMKNACLDIIKNEMVKKG